VDLDFIRRRWLSLGIVVRPGLSETQLQAFEQRHGVRLPAELRAFYRFMDGMEYGCMDEALHCFWPLSEVAAVPGRLSGCRGIPDYGGIESALPDAESYYVFADHSIWLCLFAIRLSADPVHSAAVLCIGDGRTWAVVAPSFGVFLERYMADPWSILVAE
jgi:hypothetical protein